MATSIISLGVERLRTSVCAKWIKVLRVYVPFKRRNTSSLLYTKSSSFGKVSIIFAYSSVSTFVFLSNVHRRSSTNYKIEASTIFYTLGAPTLEDLSADKSIRLVGTKTLSLFSIFAVEK